MKNKASKIIRNRKEAQDLAGKEPEGYPLYPDSEDIYGKYHKDRTINPEDPESHIKPFKILKPGRFNEMDFNDDLTGNDLDIPGSDLDDELELIGNEDEENNYYSLGGDEHHDLDEHYLDLQY
jgi:hypothetical protein